MNLPTGNVFSLGKHKMFKCWKCSFRDPVLVGFIIFIALFCILMRGCVSAFETRPQMRIE